MFDALPLPPRPNLEQYKKLAKNLAKACKSWALYAWGNSTDRERARGGCYYEAVALLVQRGAQLDTKWYEEDEERQRAREKMRSDPRMLAALQGRILQGTR